MAVKNAAEYIAKHPTWETELTELRALLRATELEETIKWGAPVYTINGKNVVGLAAFKNHYALWFYQGALLKENTALLHNAQEEKTKVMRQIRFEKDTPLKLDLINKYVLESIQNQKEGKTIKPQPKKEIQIPEELSIALKEDKDLQTSFKELTPGKQREYADHISEAKRDATKLKRLEKITPMIKNGQGLYDKYKNC